MDETFEIIYQWGLIKDDNQKVVGWHLGLRVVDSSLHATGYYGLDDPDKTYSTNCDELLMKLINSKEIYQKCKTQVEEYMRDYNLLENAVPSDFM